VDSDQEDLVEETGIRTGGRKDEEEVGAKQRIGEV
jgi:hypothetical protein